MPKITRRGGLTVAGLTVGRGRALLPAVAQVVRGEWVESETAGTGLAVNAESGVVTQPGEPLPPVEEDQWLGNSSETSPTKPPRSDEPARHSRPKRARTTAGPSASTAGSTTARTGTTSGPATDA